MSKVLKDRLFLMLLPCLEIHAAEIIGESFNIGDYNFTVYYDGRVEFKGAPSDVEEVIVPEKITYKDTEYVVTGLGKYCLNKRSKLRSVKLPETITSIGEFAFANCTSLRHIDLPNSVREIGLQCFQECTSLESITLSYSLETIGSYAFDECKSLTSIVIPDNVKTIDYCAFYDCTSLKSVIIGESVQTMGSGIFSNDSNLTEIWVKAETPPYVNGTLGRDLNSDLIIYVPENSLSQYQNAYVWRSQKLQPYSPHEFNEEVVSGGLHYKYDPMTE